jgi:acyl carrier protein|tara:strand:+ start:115 stop:354 length:240 start_codon:yes stop_codon:yes gene_type:complete
MSNKLYSIISKVMNVPESEINDQSGPETVQAWDSLNLYMLIDDIESEFNVKFTLEEILEIKNIGYFKKLLVNRGCELNE